MYDGKITDVEGLLVGHAQDTIGMTGVTVLLAPRGGVCGVSVMGSAPGTRETALMDQAKAVKEANAILLAGGSAFGLAAADGVMVFCEQQEMGFKTNDAFVPIVPAAVIYDLGYGRSDARPNTGMGYAACVNAKTFVPQGSIGVGMGATVGKVLGEKHCQKGGVGTASIRLENGVVVGAIVGVNAFGDVHDNGFILAGAHKDGAYVGTQEYMLAGGKATGFASGQNTTIGIIATNAELDRDDTTKLAQAGHDGFARSITPIHTALDGDTIFSLSYGNKTADINVLIAAAAEVMRRSVVNAVKADKAGAAV